MVRIGFIGCHEISFNCLEKICELSEKYNDEIIIAFDLIESESLKHSASINLEPLSRKFKFSLYHIKNTSESENLQLLKKSNLDILFIIGWHRIVSKEVLSMAKISLGIHSSLLPKDRGSSPLNWQLIRGEELGGTTLFHLTTGVDSGPIVSQKSFLLDFHDDIKTAYEKASMKSLELLDENWSDIHNLKPKCQPQDESKITLNPRRKPEDGLINWTKSSSDCYNFIRALTHPYPGAFTFWNDKKIFLWKSSVSTLQDSKPGEVLVSDSKIIISTGKNSLEIISLQIEGEPIYGSQEFSKHYSLSKGDIFNSMKK